jgi:general secretion pathway protein A
MYRLFFGLRERPFDLTPNPRFLVLTRGHQEALSNLEYGIASRRGITALIGEAGTGKTTLIRTALERQPERVHTVYLHNPVLTRDEFVETLATRFHLPATARTSKAQLLSELEAVLRARDAQGETTALIVDEAQSLPLDLLEEIRLLGNIETNETKLLSIVLAGQPELAARLNDASLRQLKQRIALRCELHTLQPTETAAYLGGRIRAAGGVGAQVFTREAVMLIHEQSMGIPRSINVIADNALLTAFALRVKPVNTQVIAEVARDLDLHSATTHDAATKPPDGEEGPPSILFFGNHVPEPVAAKEQVAGNAADADDPLEAVGLFRSVFPKRRRFSFLKGQ